MPSKVSVGDIMARKKADQDTLVKTILDRIDKVTDETRTEMGEMRKDVSSLANTATKQQAILEEHIRRTEANEKAVNVLTDKHLVDINDIGSRLKPLEAHISMWAGAWKVLAVLSALATIAAATYKIASSVLN